MINLSTAKEGIRFEKDTRAVLYGLTVKLDGSQFRDCNWKDAGPVAAYNQGRKIAFNQLQKVAKEAMPIVNRLFAAYNNGDKKEAAAIMGELREFIDAYNVREFGRYF